MNPLLARLTLLVALLPGLAACRGPEPASPPARGAPPPRRAPEARPRAAEEDGVTTARRSIAGLVGRLGGHVPDLGALVAAVAPGPPEACRGQGTLTVLPVPRAADVKDTDGSAPASGRDRTLPGVVVMTPREGSCTRVESTCLVSAVRLGDRVQVRAGAVRSGADGSLVEDLSTAWLVRGGCLLLSLTHSGPRHCQSPEPDARHVELLGYQEGQLRGLLGVTLLQEDEGRTRAARGTMTWEKVPAGQRPVLLVREWMGPGSAADEGPTDRPPAVTETRHRLTAGCAFERVAAGAR